MSNRVLVIDDDLEIRNLLKERLSQSGFEPLLAATGSEGMRLLYSYRPSMILLDILMPGMDGWETCRRIREACDVPVIIVSGKNNKNDIVRGFELGIDDFVTKPFECRELIARLRAVLERSKGGHAEEPSVFSCKGLRVDIRSHAVTVDDRKVKLSPTQFSLLHYLARNLNKVVSHKELLLRVWGPAYVNEREYIKLHILYLRKKIESDPKNPKFIVTERGVGYRISAET